MKIAVLGWGSLIWCPGALAIQSRWRADGPQLPIEFARISKDGRVTLVLHPGTAPTAAYWAESSFEDMSSAVANLADREQTLTKRIGTLLRSDPKSDDESVVAIQSWLASRETIEAVIWTALGSNWLKQRGTLFSLEDAEKYVSDLKIADEATFRRACEYIRNAPEQTMTPLRKRLAKAEEFEPAKLAAALFDS